jgi:hypothetical protein
MSTEDLSCDGERDAVDRDDVAHVIAGDSIDDESPQLGTLGSTPRYT